MNVRYYANYLVLKKYKKKIKKKGNLIRFEYRYVWTWRKVWIKKYPGKCGQGLGFESATLWKTEMAYYYKWRIRADIEDITRWKKQYFTNEHSEWVKYWFCHSEIKFISSSRRVMFFLLYRQKDIDKIIEGNYWNYVIDKLTCEIMENKPLGSRM